ncbi:MAG: hypothetical protein ABWX94_01125, partial [Candidatus Saccharimonadales bacterium]
ALALVLNCWAFYKQLRRNKKRKLSYYFGVEWWHRTNVGWESPFQLPETIGEIALVLWLYIGWQFGLGYPWPHLAFVALGLLIASALFYTGWRFKAETKDKDIYDAQGRFNIGWQGIVALGISTAVATLATFFGADIFEVFIITISGVIVEIIRFFLPQRWLGSRSAPRKKRKS